MHALYGNQGWSPLRRGTLNLACLILNCDKQEESKARSDRRTFQYAHTRKNRCGSVVLIGAERFNVPPVPEFVLILLHVTGAVRFVADCTT